MSFLSILSAVVVTSCRPSTSTEMEDELTSSVPAIVQVNTSRGKVISLSLTSSQRHSIQADVYETTVSDFRAFINDTDYSTTADSFGWSGIFDTSVPGWTVTEDANWEKHDGVTMANAHLPVVHVSYYDACAYCDWKGGRLPTAPEWDQLAGDSIITGNIWEGLFPHVDKGTDGYKGYTAPVGQFQPNAYGYHDMFGNVWEWDKLTV